LVGSWALGERYEKTSWGKRGKRSGKREEDWKRKLWVDGKKILAVLNPQEERGATGPQRHDEPQGATKNSGGDWGEGEGRGVCDDKGGDSRKAYG